MWGREVCNLHSSTWQGALKPILPIKTTPEAGISFPGPDLKTSMSFFFDTLQQTRYQKKSTHSLQQQTPIVPVQNTLSSLVISFSFDHQSAPLFWPNIKTCSILRCTVHRRPGDLDDKTISERLQFGIAVLTRRASIYKSESVGVGCVLRFG